jgi:hypothetical protein
VNIEKNININFIAVKNESYVKSVDIYLRMCYNEVYLKTNAFIVSFPPP